MDQTDQVEQSQQATEVSDNGGQGEKLVPVAESIRYRRRAQAAEKQSDELADQLHKAQQQTEDAKKRLEYMRIERDLTRRLSAAGTVDIEGAVVIARAKMAESQQADVESVVEQLRKEKGYLFAGQGGASAMRKSNCARVRDDGGTAAVEKAAAAAVASGSRVDLHRYLKLRRGLV